MGDALRERLLREADAADRDGYDKTAELLCEAETRIGELERWHVREQDRALVAESQVRQLREALEDTLWALTWEGEYDESVQWRDWTTCDLLLDDRGRNPARDAVITKAREALGEA